MAILKAIFIVTGLSLGPTFVWISHCIDQWSVPPETEPDLICTNCSQTEANQQPQGAPRHI